MPSNPFPSLPKLKILRRATVVIDDPSQNHRIAALNAAYDIVAIRPTSEKAFGVACTQLDIDLISIDLNVRRPFIFKFKPIAVALSRGIRLELCYAPSIASTDPGARSNVISNAMQLIRASRSRGLIISSEAPGPLALRSPFDVMNLAAIWGLAQNRGREAISIECRNVAINSAMKRNTFRGAVEIKSGGKIMVSSDLVAQESLSTPTATTRNGNGKKRKAADTLREDASRPAAGQKSKRSMKRDAKQARLGLEDAPDSRSTGATSEISVVEGLKT